MTEGDTDNTSRDGEHRHSGVYRSLDPAQELFKRVERLEERDDARELQVTSLISSRRTWAWIAGLGIPSLLGALFVFVLYAADKISASAENVGRTSARIEAIERMIASDKSNIERLIEILEQDIRELRKRAGLDSRGTVAVGAP